MDIREILQMLKKKLWIIILSTFIFTAISAILSFFILEPLYEANALIYVGKKIDAQGTVAYYDLLLGNQLVKDYRELVKSRLVSNTVIKELNLKDTTPGQLARKLSVSLKSDTRLIQIRAQDTDPKMARDIAKTITRVFKEKAIALMDVENVQIIDEAEIPRYAIKPIKKLNVAVAFVIGFMTGLGLVFLIEYFDNTVKTPQDVRKHLNLPVIGIIPDFTE